jgi:hypothetical protein
MHPQGVLTPATSVACLARRSCCRGALVACTVQQQRRQQHAQTRRVQAATRQRMRELWTRKCHRGVSRSLQIHV